MNDDATQRGLAFLAGGGKATDLILACDWSDHVLGPPEGWPTSLKTALSLVLNSPESMILCWGEEELTFFFNETYFPLLGPRIDWAMGAPFAEVWADALEQAMPIVRDAFAGKAQRFVDLPWKLDTDRGPADTWFSFSYSRILDEAGDIAGLFIFTNETTERVLADRALEASQAELRDLNASLEETVAHRTAERDRMWNTSPDLMLIGDSEGVYQQANPAWRTVLGYEPADLVGAAPLDLVHPDDRAGAADALAETKGQPVLNFNARMRHADDSYRWIQWVAKYEGDELFAIGRDIDAQMEAEEQLRATEAQLRQAQKMEAVGQLTGGIAHDFNNMLTGVIGSLDMMKRRLPPSALADVEKYIDAAMTSGQRAAALTHRLLAFSRRQSLDVKPTDVTDLVTGLEDLLHRTLGENIDLDIRLSDKSWPVLTDANQLESALINLAINARDAMPDGGTLTIHAKNVSIGAAKARAHDIAPGDYVALCVCDTGQGMDADTLSRVFEPFFTTKPIGKGTGLGLSMIYGFVQQAGGRVSIDSTPGEGTAIVMDLPRATDAAAPTAEDATSTHRAQDGHCVLVVEDEEIVRGLLVEVLKDMGYDAVEAGTAEMALSALKDMKRIDLMITDVGLPGMNGRDLAQKVRETHPDLKILFATGYAQQATLRGEFLDEGMEMIAKPFDVDDLAATIGRLVEG